MANMTFVELAEKVLAEVMRPLSPSEIWKVAVAQGYDSLLRARQGKTPERTLYSAIFTDARQNPETAFVKFGDRPARYYLKKLAQERQPDELEQAASTEATVPEKYDYKESQLHPFSPVSSKCSSMHTRKQFDTPPLRKKSLENGYIPTWLGFTTQTGARKCSN
jgi:uncharacterized protein